MWRTSSNAMAVIALAVATASPAWGVTCAPDANGSYLAGWTAAPLPTNCNQVPATSGSPTALGANASWYVLVRSALTAPNDVVWIDAPTNISYNGANGFGPVIGNQYLTHGSINFTDVTATITNTGANGGINGLTTSLTVPLNGSSFTYTAVSGNYTGGNSSGTVASYGILAGSSVNAGETGTANNGKFSAITLDNATIKQTYAGGLIQPVLNSGLRAIQGAYLDSGNGGAGKIEIRDTLDMTLTGARIEGIYVSGAASDSGGNEAVSQVVLNDSTIKMVKSGSGTWDSSAIKIGKTRAIGTGKGLVVSSGALKIDMDSTLGGAQPYMSSAIKMAVSGSQLLANGTGSSASITAARSALAIGIDDWSANVDSGGASGPGIQTLFGNATVKTQSTTAPLLLVDSGQQDVQMLFDNASDLTAASNGYLVDIVKYRTSTTASSARLTFDHASVAKGLTNKSYANSTLDIGLNNASIWNLVEKTNGDKTSTYTTFAMMADSTLNAFKSGAAAFVMNGPVTSDASTINLLDGAPDDVLTIQPSYTGSGDAALAVDTCLGDDTAPSDVLKVVGDTSGDSIIKVMPVPGAGCGGALTTGNGILVVQVSGNSAGVFTLDGGTIPQGNFVYHLVKVGNDWYLQSQRLASTVTLQKQIDAPSGAPPYSGSFDFTADCGADGTFTGTVVLINATTGSGSIANVPAGATCSISETTIPTAPTNYQWGATPPAVSVTTTEAGPNTAAFTNTLTRQTSTINLTKTVTGGPAGGMTGSFGFTANCGMDGTFTGTVVLTNATTGGGSIASLPAGATCSVSETTIPTAPANYQWGATPPAASVTTTEAGPNTAAFTNTLTRQSSSIVLTKTVIGSPSGGITATFGFTANCGVDGTFAGTVALTNATTGSDSIANVPAGATCSVSETTIPTAPANYQWGATPPAASVTTTEAGPNTAAFTNTLTRQSSSIVLTKTVIGSPSGGITATFGFTANCGVDGTFAGTVALTNATTGSDSIANVPAGATCSVGETTIPTAPVNYQWGATPPAVSVTTTEAGPNTAAFTNTLIRGQAILTVNKQVTGAPANGAPGTYHFIVACENPTASYDGSVTLNGTATSGLSDAISIPMGSTGCTVAEDIATRPTAPTNYDWDAPIYTQPPGIIDGNATGVVVNPLKSQSGPGQEALPVPIDLQSLFWLIAGIGLIGSLTVSRRRL